MQHRYELTITSVSVHCRVSSCLVTIDLCMQEMNLIWKMSDAASMFRYVCFEAASKYFRTFFIHLPLFYNLYSPWQAEGS